MRVEVEALGKVLGKRAGKRAEKCGKKCAEKRVGKKSRLDGDRASHKEGDGPIRATA